MHVTRTHQGEGGGVLCWEALQPIYIYIYKYVYIYTYVCVYICIYLWIAYNTHAPGRGRRRPLLGNTPVRAARSRWARSPWAASGSNAQSRCRQPTTSVEEGGGCGGGGGGKKQKNQQVTHTPTENTTPDTHTRQEQHPKPPNEHPPQTLNNARRWRDDGARQAGVNPRGWRVRVRASINP